MADLKATALPELAEAPETTDLLYIVDDPGGAPESKNITVANLINGVWDSDAAQFFVRSEAVGSTIPIRTKLAVNDFIIGCKQDSVWSKITEAYLLGGLPFANLTAKLKYSSVATLTNSGFVAGDYVEFGSAFGLTGDGTSYLNTGFAPPAITGSLGVYVADLQDQYFIGTATSGYGQRFNIYQSGGEVLTFWTNNVVEASAVPAGSSGTYIGTRRANNDLELYENGVSFATNTGAVAGGAVTASPFLLFAINNGGTPAFFTTARLGFAFVGTSVTDSEAAYLSTRIANLMNVIAV